MEDNYTKRELDEHFREVKDELKEIKIQVLKTNGRVGSLEKWRWLMTGALIAVGAMGIPGFAGILRALSGI